MTSQDVMKSAEGTQSIDNYTPGMARRGERTREGGRWRGVDGQEKLHHNVGEKKRQVLSPSH